MLRRVRTVQEALLRLDFSAFPISYGPLLHGGRDFAILSNQRQSDKHPIQPLLRPLSIPVRLSIRAAGHFLLPFHSALSCTAKTVSPQTATSLPLRLHHDNAQTQSPCCNNFQPCSRPPRFLCYFVSFTAAIPSESCRHPWPPHRGLRVRARTLARTATQTIHHSIASVRFGAPRMPIARPAVSVTSPPSHARFHPRGSVILWVCAPRSFASRLSPAPVTFSLPVA